MADVTDGSATFKAEKHAFDEIGSAPEIPVVTDGVSVPEPPVQDEPRQLYKLVPADAPEPAPKKPRTGLKVALICLAALLVGTGLFSFFMYRSVMGTVDELTADGQSLAGEVQALTDHATAMDFSAALGDAEQIKATAGHMRELISDWRFDVLSLVPRYGGDVKTGRALLDILVEADGDIAMPLLRVLADNPAETLVSKSGGVNANGVYAIMDAVDVAVPKAEQLLDRVDKLDPFVIPQLADAVNPTLQQLKSAKSFLDGIRAALSQMRPVLDSMVGREGDGSLTQWWPFISKFMGKEGVDLLRQLLPLITVFMGEDAASSIESLFPLLGLFSGEGGTLSSGDVPKLFGMLTGDNAISLEGLGALAGVGEQGPSGGYQPSMESILGLLTDENGSFSLKQLAPLMLLFTDEDGEISADAMAPLMELFFGGSGEGAPAEESEPSTGDEESTDLWGSLLPLIGLVLGGGEEVGIPA